MKNDFASNTALGYASDPRDSLPPRTNLPNFVKLLSEIEDTIANRMPPERVLGFGTPAYDCWCALLSSVSRALSKAEALRDLTGKMKTSTDGEAPGSKQVSPAARGADGKRPSSVPASTSIVCERCKLSKAPSFFHRHRATANGYRRVCKSCSPQQAPLRTIKRKVTSA